MYFLRVNPEQVSAQHGEVGSHPDIEDARAVVEAKPVGGSQSAHSGVQLAMPSSWA
jgi:hypothetical protein